MDRKRIRKLCPHYQSGGWCRYCYNTASDFDKEHYHKSKANHWGIPQHEELINTCYPEACKIWFDEVYKKTTEPKEAFKEPETAYTVFKELEVLEEQRKERYSVFQELVKKDSAAFAELVMGLKLNNYQRDLFRKISNLPDKARRVYVVSPRIRCGTEAYTKLFLEGINKLGDD